MPTVARARAKVYELVRLPLEKSAFYNVDLAIEPMPTWDQEICAAQVRHVLRRMGLTMTHVSSLTSMRYGKKSAYFMPGTFLYRQRQGVTPHICQIVALSQITGYRFADWMKIYGFDLRLIPILQVRVHTERTSIVTPSQIRPSYDSSIVLRNASLRKENERYLFAKIGSRDAVVYPTVLPGSIVRADRCHAPEALDKASGDDRLWLVEHAGGVTCCYVKPVDAEHVMLLPNRPPLSGWPLRLLKEVRILGLVDLELRPREPAQFRPMCGVTRSELLPQARSYASSSADFSTLVRISRSRSSLTLRAAHEMTMRIAKLLGNRQYGIALGLLSDYEATNRVPRHVAKIISLCITYGIDPFELTGAGGIHIDDSDKAPLVLPDGRCDLRQIA